MDQTVSFELKYRNVTHDLLHFNSMKTNVTHIYSTLTLWRQQIPPKNIGFDFASRTAWISTWIKYSNNRNILLVWQYNTCSIQVHLRKSVHDHLKFVYKQISLCANDKLRKFIEMPSKKILLQKSFYLFD